MMLLPFIGTRDDVELLGYTIERCPSCETVGVFGVYDAKKRLTIYMIPTRPFSQQQVLECKTCHSRFGVPEDQQAALAKRLLTQDELSARIKQIQGQGGGHGAGAFTAGFGPGANGSAVGAGRRTLYQVLQVDPSADPEVIEAAFKRLAFKHHPDRSADPDSPERMRELIEAREMLSDPARRRAYDLSIGAGRAGSPPPPNGRADRAPSPPPPARPRPPAMRPEEV